MTPEEKAATLNVRAAIINARAATLNATIAGMQAENQYRLHRGEAPAYCEDSFQVIAKEYPDLRYNDLMGFSHN